MSTFEFLLAPFVVSLVLTGIHAYLGVHVVERGVIFVDLALAQIAALGATVAILIEMDPHGSGSYWVSLGFTVLGAAIFALVRMRRAHIPQEAFIGIAYAVASAAAILVTSKTIGETEHLKHFPAPADVWQPRGAGARFQDRHQFRPLRQAAQE